VLPLLGIDRDKEPLVLDWRPLLERVLEGLRSGQNKQTLAALVHASLASAIATVAREIGEKNVLLTGGCFQNRTLTELAIEQLRAAGFEAYWHRRVPPNDGGLAVGQAAWAARVMGSMGSDSIETRRSSIESYPIDR